MSLMVGNGLGFRADINSFYALYERRAGAREWFAWLFSDAAPALVSGLFVIAFVSAIVGYVVSVVAWRWWTGIKWKRRLARADEA